MTDFIKGASVTVGSSRQLEVHSYSWLSDLQLGQATKVLQKEKKLISCHLKFFPVSFRTEVSAPAAHWILALTNVLTPEMKRFSY